MRRAQLRSSTDAFQCLNGDFSVKLAKKEGMDRSEVASLVVVSGLRRNTIVVAYQPKADMAVPHVGRISLKNSSLIAV